MTSDDRRRSPRVAILGNLHGRVVTLDVPVAVLEISLGGMGIQTTVRFPIGAVHDFQLTLGDKSLVHLKGRVVHCTRQDGEDERYIAGIEFLDEGVET